MRIRVIESVLKSNAAGADDNRRRLAETPALAVNITSAPGSGKTALLERTLAALGQAYPAAVLVGDLQTTRDAERLSGLAAWTTQINTGRGCHLTAAQVAAGLTELPLAELAFIFIENVGNMVCPAAFDLGEHVRVALLSVPEGDDKVAKYPTLFQPADLILLTKVDLRGVLEHDLHRVRADLAKLNTRAPLIEFSARTDQGLGAWLDWLHAERQRRCGAAAAEKSALRRSPAGPLGSVTR